VKEFSKNAKSYDSYNIIQKSVASNLVKMFKKRYKSILDLGCGSGAIYNLIDWQIDEFVGVDSSKNMCSLHPKAANIKIYNMDYEKPSLYEEILRGKRFELVCSSSSLQWCKNLEKTVESFSKLSDSCAISIFCDGTFKTIYEISKLDTFLPNYKEVLKIFERFYEISFKREFYKLYFDDNISKFRYIKKSGVSGGERRLGYKDTKNLIENYPLEYLEFEVVYILGEKKSPSV